MKEKIETTKRKLPSDLQEKPVPPGALLIENTKIITDAEERRRLIKAKEAEIAKKIEILFEQEGLEE